MAKTVFEKIITFLKVVKESKRPGSFVVAQLLAKTGLCKFFIIKMNGYKLRFTPSALSITLFSNRADRDSDEDFLRSVLKEGDVYVDVGANIGTLALCASQIVGNTGKVIAIEAHPRTYTYLSKNIFLNNFTNIRQLNFAAGNKEGTLIFSDINSDDQNKVIVGSENGIKVPVTTLNLFMEKENEIKLIKIDVEGFEKFVIEGAREILKKTNMVFFESWDQHFNTYGYTVAEVISLLESMNFIVYKVEGKKRIIVSPLHRSVECENLLAIKADR
jgi:FkbM family methyltransferase